MSVKTYHREPYNSALGHDGPRETCTYVYPQLLGRLPVAKYPERKHAKQVARDRFGPGVSLLRGGRYWAVMSERVDGATGHRGTEDRLDVAAALGLPAGGDGSDPGVY